MGDIIRKSITVNRGITEVYNLWENYENYPHFMRNIRSVERTGDQTSHWVMDGPGGKNLEWNTITTAREPNKRLAWRSTEGDLRTEGQVMFNSVAPDRTELSVMMSYDAPSGEPVNKVFDNPDRILEKDLESFKRYAEGRGSTGSSTPRK